MIEVVRQRNFALLWFAGLISMLGDWMLFIALPIYTYELTQSSLATGMMFMTGTLPRLLLGSVAGVFVDRWDRRQTMIVADLSRAVLLLLLLFVRSPESIWMIYIVAFLQAVISQFFGPAENALLPQLVDRSHLVAANSLNALNNNFARLGGPALGGLLLGSVGFRNVVLIDSLSFLVSGILIALIASVSLTPRREKVGELTARPLGVWEDWLSGLRSIVRSSTVFLLFVVMGIAGVAEGLFNVMFVIFIKDNLGGGALEFGWLTSVQAIGGLLGGLIIGWVGSRIRPNRLTGLLAANGVLILLMANFASLPSAMVLILLAGVPIVGFSVGVNTLVQEHVADRYRGRVFGALTTSMAIFMLLGQGCASFLGDRLGPVPLLSVKGMLDITAGLLAFIMLYRVNSPEPTPEAG
ncbi:MAG TPA: MFS transporter [Anaerolineales bacterium]